MLLILWKNRYLIYTCKIIVNIYWIQKIGIHNTNFMFSENPGQEECHFSSLAFLHAKWGTDFKISKINLFAVFIDIHSICLLWSIFVRFTLFFFIFPILLLKYCHPVFQGHLYGSTKVKISFKYDGRHNSYEMYTMWIQFLCMKINTMTYNA